MSSTFIREEVTAAQVAFVQQACTLAAIVLLLYETCQTADLELAYIWARGRARMSILFVVLRHVEVAGLILNSISYAFMSPEMCGTFNRINAIIVVIPYLSWAIFLGWRAYALSSSNAFVGLLVFICSLSFASPSLVLIIGSVPTYVATTAPTCVNMYRWADVGAVVADLVNVSRPVNIFAEAIVLALTFRTSYRAWLSSKRANRPASLPGVLYENGVICFSVGTVLHIVSHVLTVFRSENNPFFSTVSVFRDALITVFLSRFILELAKVGAQTSDADQGARATRGILTTEWTEGISDIPSQWTLDDEYNGRGFDKDIETFELKARYEA